MKTNTAHASFRLGQILATPGALEAIETAGQNPADFIMRHAAGDWGDVCAEDKAQNDASLGPLEHVPPQTTKARDDRDRNHDGRMRLLSVYYTAQRVKLYIITEWDRSATTLLLPSEY